MEVYQSSKTAAEMEYALGAVPSIGENGNWFIGEQDTGIFAKGINVSGAEVGQTVKVAAVDENGVPTAWEAANLEESPFDRTPDIVATIEQDNVQDIYWTDIGGVPLDAKEAYVLFEIPANANGGWFYYPALYNIAISNMNLGSYKAQCIMNFNFPTQDVHKTTDATALFHVKKIDNNSYLGEITFTFDNRDENLSGSLGTHLATVYPNIISGESSIKTILFHFTAAVAVGTVIKIWAVKA